jgi:hypothetical protein
MEEPQFSNLHGTKKLTESAAWRSAAPNLG